MNNRSLWVGLLAVSTLGVGYEAVASEAVPATAADTQDKRESKLVMLKLPAMV